MFRVAVAALALSSLSDAFLAQDVEDVQCTPDNLDGACESDDSIALLQTDVAWQKVEHGGARSARDAGHVAPAAVSRANLEQIALNHHQGHRHRHQLSGSGHEPAATVHQAEARWTAVDGAATRRLQLIEVAVTTAGSEVVVFLIICGVAVVVGGAYGVSSGKGVTRGAIIGATLAALSTAIVAGVASAMFLDVDGGGQAFTSWIAWHAILMTLAFPGLMVIGRLVYIAEGDILETVLGEKSVRRRAHRAIMSCAVLSAIGGYLCIFISHWPGKKYFWYDFTTGAWAAAPRIVHVYLGYMAVLTAVAQAIMGAFKMNLFLTDGERIFTFHGTLGKFIIICGCTNILTASYFWGWSVQVKIVISALSVAAASGGALCQRETALTDETGKLSEK